MLIIGAGGFAKELLFMLSKVKIETELTFYDDITEDKGRQFLEKFAVLNNEEELKNYFINKTKQYIIGVAKPAYRKSIYNKINALGGNCTTIYSPTADIGKFENNFGEGVIVMDKVIVETSDTIGKGTLIHCNSFISHDVTIGDFCEISPFVKLLGNVTVGNCCAIGTGAILLPGITIGDNVVIGAGAVVTKNISSNETAVGIPAQVVKKNNQ